MKYLSLIAGMTLLVAGIAISVVCQGCAPHVVAQGSK